MYAHACYYLFVSFGSIELTVINYAHRKRINREKQSRSPKKTRIVIMKIIRHPGIHNIALLIQKCGAQSLLSLCSTGRPIAGAS